MVFYASDMMKILDLLSGAIGSDNIDYIEEQLKEIEKIIVKNNIGIEV